MLEVSHDFAEEDLLAKAEWLQALTPVERYEAMVDMVEMLKKMRPSLGREEETAVRWPGATVRVLAAVQR